MKNTNIFYLYFAYSISNILMRFLKKNYLKRIIGIMVNIIGSI